jgi:hypothetical protein
MLDVERVDIAGLRRQLSDEERKLLDREIQAWALTVLMRNHPDYDRQLAEFLKVQRECGWPDVHPEDYCHRCGQRNVRSWAAPSEVFKTIAEPHEIICPQCMSEAWEKQHGLTTWRIEPLAGKRGSANG